MDTKLCFVIMGYGKKPDPVTGKSYDLDQTYLEIIKPSVEKAGYKCIRGDEIMESGLIDQSMYQLLIKANLVIADITTYNPNAIYELGIRHAARPYATIVMKEKEGNIPFDISHTKIFEYTHMGEDISVKEARRCINDLHELIVIIDSAQTIDSPLFAYIPDALAHSLSSKDYDSLIEKLAKKEKNLFASVSKAKKLMRKNKFSEAATIWLNISSKVENDPYYIQQAALCTYKSKEPDRKMALIDALNIINALKVNNELPNDSETLGITGAIYKNLYEIDQDPSYLDRAIASYERGFKINSDYYTGENYALCLNLKSNLIKDENEKIYYKIEAKKTREKILDIIQSYKLDEDFIKRTDIKWIYATLSNCYFALDKGKNAKEAEDKFRENSDADWEIETFEKYQAMLLEIL